MKQMKLSVVIVNYNVKHFLWQCLDSVRRASKGLDVEVWVVDNASTDKSIDYVRVDYPNIHFIENTENVGFAKANNQAIRQATGDLVLLLNPDTFITEDTLSHCIHFFEEHPRAGALGIHMVNRDGSFARESRRGLPTPATSLYKVIGLGRLFPTHPRFAKYYMGHLPEFADGQVEVLSGAFMMLRRKALEEVGLLDETYFMYGEDIELSYRIGCAGWECWYTPKLMLHYKGESTQQTSIRYVYNFYHAMLIFFRKNFSHRYWYAWLLVEMAVLTMGILSMARKWLKRSWHWLKKITRIRRWQQSRPDSPETILFIGSDAAWMQVQDICSRKGLAATRADEVPADPTMPNYLYVVFEVTNSEHPYQNILWQLVAAHRQGVHSHLGTYNQQTHTLILPNDIYC